MSYSALDVWARQPAAKIPLSKVLDLFDAAYRAQGRSPRTIAWYRERLTPYVTYLTTSLVREPAIADFSITNFRLFILERMDGGKYANHPNIPHSINPPSPGHVHGFYRAARGFSSWLYAERLTPVNVMAELKMPKLDQKELQPLTPEEETRLISCYSDRNSAECRNKAIMMLMLSTGLRKGEVVTLRDSAVNLDEGFLTVWGKGRRQRSVPFGHRTGAVLQRYRLIHRPDPIPPNCDAFFLTREGYPITHEAIKMIFDRARKRSGIPRLHPHLLRHTYGTRSAELGIPTLTLQRFMGHSQPTVTERYSHIAQSEQIKRERAYDHLDQLDLKLGRTLRRA